MISCWGISGVSVPCQPRNDRRLPLCHRSLQATCGQSPLLMPLTGISVLAPKSPHYMLIEGFQRTFFFGWAQLAPISSPPIIPHLKFLPFLSERSSAHCFWEVPNRGARALPTARKLSRNYFFWHESARTAQGQQVLIFQLAGKRSAPISTLKIGSWDRTKILKSSARADQLSSHSDSLTYTPIAHF
jgi:hypothetical protein